MGEGSLLWEPKYSRHSPESEGMVQREKSRLMCHGTARRRGQENASPSWWHRLGSSPSPGHCFSASGGTKRQVEDPWAQHTAATSPKSSSVWSW